MDPECLLPRVPKMPLVGSHNLAEIDIFQFTQVGPIHEEKL